MIIQIRLAHTLIWRRNLHEFLILELLINDALDQRLIKVPKARKSEEMPKPAGVTTFGERREVTALFYDLIGSTELLARSDLEDYQEVIAGFQDLSGNVLRSHGGTIDDILGDGGLAYFGHPVPSEDSAVAAIFAALDLIDACQRLAADTGMGDLRLRIGIATSDVVVTEPAAEHGVAITGLAPTLASRLQNLAPPNEVAICPRTRKLAQGNFAFKFLGNRKIKGFEEKYPIWSVKRPVFGTPRFLASDHVSGPLVGREAEFSQISDCVKRSLAGDGQTIVVAGEAGIGKSRIVYEVLRSLGIKRERHVLLQCSPRNTVTEYSPLVEFFQSVIGPAEASPATGFERIGALMRGAGITDEKVIKMIATAAGVEVPVNLRSTIESPQDVREQIVLAVLACLEQWIRKGPIVILVEDVQWIDPTSKEVLREICKWVPGKPVSIIMTTRELVTWTGTGTHVTHFALDSLSELETLSLVKNLNLGTRLADMPSSMLSMIFQRTNGIPLYLEELLLWLQEASDRDGSNIADLLSNSRILSLENILASRLGRMGEAKIVAQAASVIGREFNENLLTAVLQNIPRRRIEKMIEQLILGDLFVRQIANPHFPLAFRHTAIQEALYNALLRKARRSLHEKVYLAASKAGSTTRPSLLGVHAEQAGLFQEAATHYIAAAQESFARFSVEEATRLLDRVKPLLRKIADKDNREKLELSMLATLGPVLTSTIGTKSPEACRLYERAVRIARRRPASEKADWFPVYWGWWYTGSDFGVQRSRAASIMSDLGDVDDPDVRLQVHHCVWAIDFNTGHHDSCVAAVDAGLQLYNPETAREGLALYGGHDAKVCGLGQKGLSLWLKGFPSQAANLIDQSVSSATELEHVGSLAHAYDIAAMLHCYRRDHDSLRRIIGAMHELADSHRLPLLGAKADIFEGWTMARLGNAAGGLKTAEKGLALQEDIGTREDFPVYAEMLSQVLGMLFEHRKANDLLSTAIEEAERTGHLYWLPELYRRRALFKAKINQNDKEIASLINSALQLALDQNAVTLFLRAFGSAMELKISDAVTEEIKSKIGTAINAVEAGGELASLVKMIKTGLPSVQAADR